MFNNPYDYIYEKRQFSNAIKINYKTQMTGLNFYSKFLLLLYVKSKFKTIINVKNIKLTE